MRNKHTETLKSNIDECEKGTFLWTFTALTSSGTHNCEAPATCIDMEGSFDCGCPKGKSRMKSCPVVNFS